MFQLSTVHPRIQCIKTILATLLSPLMILEGATLGELVRDKASHMLIEGDQACSSPACSSLYLQFSSRIHLSLTLSIFVPWLLISRSDCPVVIYDLALDTTDKSHRPTRLRGRHEELGGQSMSISIIKSSSDRAGLRTLFQIPICLLFT